MYKNTLLFILVFLIVISISCDKEESSTRLSGFGTPVLTGFEFRDKMGMETGNYGGYPNNKTQYSNYSVVCYPNPCYKNLCVEVSPYLQNENINIWLTPAVYKGKPIDGVNLANSNYLRAGGFPIFTAQDNNTVIHTDDIIEGYYRLYVKINEDILLYDNIIIFDGEENK